MIFPDGQIHLMLRGMALFGETGGYVTGNLGGDNEFNITDARGYQYTGSLSLPVLHLELTAHGSTFQRQLELSISSREPLHTNPFHDIVWNFTSWQDRRLEHRNNVAYKKTPIGLVNDESFPWIDIYHRAAAYCPSSNLKNLWLMFNGLGWCASGSTTWPWLYSEHLGWLYTDDTLWPWLYSNESGWLYTNDAYQLHVWSSSEG